MSHQKYCCEAFPKLILKFDWFAYEAKDELLLPHFDTPDGDKIKVLYCPSCGKPCCDIIITRNEFLKSLCG